MSQQDSGLCGRCGHARQIVSGRGSSFTMCEQHAHDDRLRKYPPLPVLTCHAFAATGAATDEDA